MILNNQPKDPVENAVTLLCAHLLKAMAVMAESKLKWLTTVPISSNAKSWIFKLKTISCVAQWTT
jgi:hypothetical protein